MRGKIVVVAGLACPSSPRSRRGRPGRAAAERRRTRAPNPLGESCKDYLTPEEAAAKNGALVAVDHALSAVHGMLTRYAVRRTGRRRTRRASTARLSASRSLQQPPACPAVPGITAGLEHGQRHFPGRKTRRLADLLRGRREHQAGFVRAERREEDSTCKSHARASQITAKTSSACSKAAIPS